MQFNILHENQYSIYYKYPQLGTGWLKGISHRSNAMRHGDLARGTRGKYKVKERGKEMKKGENEDVKLI